MGVSTSHMDAASAGGPPAKGVTQPLTPAQIAARMQGKVDPSHSFYLHYE